MLGGRVRRQESNVSVLYSQPRLYLPFRSRIITNVRAEATCRLCSPTTAWRSARYPRPCSTSPSCSPVDGESEKRRRTSSRIERFHEAPTTPHRKETASATQRPKTSCTYLRASITGRSSPTSSVLRRAILAARAAAAAAKLCPPPASSPGSITGASSATVGSSTQHSRPGRDWRCRRRRSRRLELADLGTATAAPTTSRRSIVTAIAGAATTTQRTRPFRLRLRAPLHARRELFHPDTERCGQEPEPHAYQLDEGQWRRRGPDEGREDPHRRPAVEVGGRGRVPEAEGVPGQAEEISSREGQQCAPRSQRAEVRCLWCWVQGVLEAGQLLVGRRDGGVVAGVW